METEICETCNQPKTMYYKLYCHKCEKPKIETLHFYNLLRCLYHIEANGHPGYKKRMIDKLSEDIGVNDSYIVVSNDINDDADADINLLFKTFEIKEEYMTFYVSW